MDFSNLKQFMDHMAEEHVPGNAVQVYLDGEKAFEYAVGYGYGLGVCTHISPEKSGLLCNEGEFGWSGAAGSCVIVDPRSNWLYFMPSIA